MDSTKGTNEEIRAADEEVTAAADEIARCEVSFLREKFGFFFLLTIDFTK